MEDQNNEIEEMQVLEQRLNSILVQKQSFQIELSETESALKELGDSEGDVFKVVGQIMVKSDREKMKQELLEREKMIELRIKSLEKQENSFMEKMSVLRDEILKKMKK